MSCILYLHDIDTIVAVVVPPWPKSVVWYNKEGRVEASENVRIVEDGLGMYMIEIKESTSSDAGEWKCVVTSTDSSFGSVGKGFLLPFFINLFFLIQNQNIANSEKL